MAYAGGWKKLEPLWDLVIRAKRVSVLLPVLEAVLDGGKAAGARWGTVAGLGDGDFSAALGGKGGAILPVPDTP